MGYYSTFKKTVCTLKFAVITVVLIIIVSILSAFTYSIKNVFPETEMVLNSKCSNPYLNWDGKILDVPVYKSGYSNRPSYFNIHNENEYNDSSVVPYKLMSHNRPIIIWGTHHKTGTFVAKKIFAKICARMNWCCLFHVTRDSVHAVNHALHTETNINVLGHNQWLWDPLDLNISNGNFKFVHFYRHPFKKVISGYRYHFDGTEAWTKKDLDFHSVCDNSMSMSSTSPPRAMIAGSNNSSGNVHSKVDSPYHQNKAVTVSEETVYDFCAHTYLCQTCCRLEHEDKFGGKQHLVESGTTLDLSTIDRVHLTGNIPLKHSPRGRSNRLRKRHRRASMEIPVATAETETTGRRLSGFTTTSKKYFKRRDYEYQYICKHLGSLNGSLQQSLHTTTAESGILTEAALDYYENLKMARLVNQTLNDPRSLNIDLDAMNRDFSGAIWQILGHLQGLIPEPMLIPLHEELMFYDLQSSPLYRWSMSNPLINHVADQSSGAQHTSSDLMTILKTNPEVKELYRPVFELMDAVLKRDKAAAAAASVH